MALDVTAKTNEQQISQQEASSDLLEAATHQSQAMDCQAVLPIYTPSKFAIDLLRQASTWEKERKNEHAVPTTAKEQRENQLSQLEAAMSQVKDELHWFGESTQKLNRDLAGLKSDYKQLGADVDQHIRLGKHRRLVLYADEAALRVQAVKDDGRRRALAHVGISSCAIAPDGWPWGARIRYLKENWERTWWSTLTHQQKREMTRRFGNQFMSFLEKDALVMDTPEARRPVYMLSRNMPWAEKAYIMEAIDYLKPEAVREGGRIAYMAFLGCESWEVELRRVYGMLAAKGCDVQHLK